MKNIFVLAGAAILLTLSSCHKDNRLPDYQQLTFIDEFNDDYNRWTFRDYENNAYGFINDGMFNMGYNDDLYDTYYISQDIGFNRYNDFTIQTGISSNKNIGLLFGYNSSTGANGYSFTIDYDGNFALYDEGGNGYGPDIAELVPLSTAPFINGGGGWNDIVFKQVGSRWLGYINGNEVFNIQAQNLKAGSVGYLLTFFTQGESDYLQVDWLQ